MPPIVLSQPHSADHLRNEASGARLVQSAHLQGLMAQIADKNQIAFSHLYDALSPQLLGEVRSAPTTSHRAAAVVSATFIEVWTLARFHTGPGQDVAAWITEIAVRRITDRQSSDHAHSYDHPAAASVGSPERQPWWTVVADAYDRQCALHLAALLDRPGRRHP